MESRACLHPYAQWHDRAWHWLAAVDPDIALVQECAPPTWATERWDIAIRPYTRWASAVVSRRGLDVQPITVEPTSLLGDPAYVLPDRQGSKPGIDYASVITANTDLHAQYLAEKPALLIARFGGDGTFPVFGEFEGGELLRVVVEFVDPPEDDQDD